MMTLIKTLMSLLKFKKRRENVSCRRNYRTYILYFLSEGQGFISEEEFDCKQIQTSISITITIFFI